MFLLDLLFCKILSDMLHLRLLLNVEVWPNRLVLFYELGFSFQSNYINIPHLDGMDRLNTKLQYRLTVLVAYNKILNIELELVVW